MLSDLNIKARQELHMTGLGPALPARFPLTFLGSPEFPWQLKNVSGLVTTGAAIGIIGVTILDENSNTIFGVGMQPWMFANTVNNVNANQSPEVPFVALFGPPVITGIPSDFYVYSNWELQVNMINGVVGSSYILTAIFMQGFFGDKYRI